MTTGIDPAERSREFAKQIRGCLDDLANRVMRGPLTAMKLHDWLDHANDVVDHFTRGLPPAPYLVVRHIDRLPAICEHALSTEFYADRPVTYAAATTLEAGDLVEFVNIDDEDRAELKIGFGGAMMRLRITVTCLRCTARTAARLLVPTADRGGYVERKCRQCDYGWRQWPAFA